jgi:transposase InsO family protein
MNSREQKGRIFSGKKTLEVVASDLTYVRVGKEWHYICLLVELAHREIIGHAASNNKDAELVKAAWYSIKEYLRKICIFHSDRGSEFKNVITDELLETFEIKRSLSAPGSPIDNAVSESMYDIVKTEFIYEERFTSPKDLQDKLSAWVWWYNNERIHSSLGYITPVESREAGEIGVTEEKLANKSYQNFWKKVSLHTQKISIESTPSA